MSGKKQGVYVRCIKRVLDFFISLTALIILSPVMLLLMLLGAWQMRGNPFFVQPRPGKIGKDGKEKIFKLIKFRTMTNKKDKDGNLLPDSERLNGYGTILRKTSLDELPELLNIISGSCSIVGPRPLLVKYLPRYTEKQRHRHDVRPGLTGYAQVNGRNSVSWEERFEMDLWYTRNISFLLDFKIVICTIVTVFKREGITQEGSATMDEFLGSGV